MSFDLVSDTTKLCRVCMTAKEGHRTDLYDATSFVSGQPSLYGMLKAVCAPVFAKPVDEGGPSGMPTKVCAVCRNATIAAFKLHLMCIETERRLGELLVRKKVLQAGLGGDKEIGDDGGDPLMNNNKDALQPEMQQQLTDFEDKRGDEKESDRLEPSHEIDKEFVPNKEDAIKVEGLDLVDEFESEDIVFDSVEHQEPVTIDGKVKITCQTCKETFYKASMLRKHMTLKHHLYMCEICHETFGSLSWFVKHKAMKHKRRTVCLNCGEKFMNKVDLKIHHEQRSCSERISECPICKQTFTTRVALFKHRITHRTLLKCSICDIITSSKAKHELHMRRHMGVKQLACNSCPMRFHTKIELESHMLTHTKIKNAICDICGSRFTKKESLKMHVKRVHEGCTSNTASISTAAELFLHISRLPSS